MLWASRLDYQKNPAVVFDIARRMPEVQFDVFGRQVLSDPARLAGDAFRNRLGPIETSRPAAGGFLGPDDLDKD